MMANRSAGSRHSGPVMHFECVKPMGTCSADFIRAKRSVDARIKGRRHDCPTSLAVRL